MTNLSEMNESQTPKSEKLSSEIKTSFFLGIKLFS